LAGTTIDTNITIKNLTPDTWYEFTVKTVSKTGLKSDESSVVKVKTDSNNQSEEPASVHVWKANKVYDAGSVVRYKNNLYKAQWYTCGDEPGTNGEYGVWKLIEENLSGSDDDYKEDNTWDKESVYLAGETVEYQGQLYEAQWYTQGQQPDPNNQYGPWKLVAAA
ncbi:MAG: carbohydrate-binding protein, partial [Clostridium sp.]